MSVKITKDTSGLDQLKKNLGMLGQENIQIQDYLTPDFISRHSEYADLLSFASSMGHQVQSITELENISDAEWEEIVKAKTEFQSWDEMRKEALGIHVMEKLSKGL